MCEKFGWTVNELYDQPLEHIQKFIQIMSIEAQQQAREAPE